MKKTILNYTAWLSWRRPWVWLLGLFLFYNLALAVVTPMVIKNRLNDIVVNQLKLDFDIDRVSINPYALTLTLDNLKISGGDLGQPLGFSQLLINFELWGSLSGVWTFREAHLLGVYGEFNRFNNETNNFTATINNWSASQTQNEEEKSSETTETAALPRLNIADIRLQIAQFRIADQVPESKFETDIGPIDFHIEDLSTLPNTSGKQSLVLKTATGAELNWQGNITLSPFASEGEVALKGPVLTTLADYLKDDIKVAVTTSDMQAKFHYAINLPEQQNIKIRLTDIEASLHDLKVNQHPGNQPLLALQQAQVSNGELQWPEAIIRLQHIQLSDGDVWARVTPQGQLNFSQLLATDDSSNEQSSPWTIVNEQLNLERMQFHYRDESTSTPSNIQVEDISVNVKHLSSQPNQAIEAAASFSLLGGKFESTANLQLNPLAKVEGTYKIAKLPIKAAQSFIDDYALVEVADGELAAEGKMTSNNDVIKIQGNAQIDQFKMLEKGSGKILLTWSQLKLNRIIADLSTQKINIGRMQFDQAYADFDIAANGTHTFARILKEAEPATPEAAATESSNELSYLIGRIDFENASGKFTDSSLPLPFSADIAKINGSISTLDSTSHTPAKIKLEGQVSDYGEMLMNGAIFPLEPTQKTQMSVSFNNIDIAEFSPYSIKFAGREIAKGKMDLDLEYDINQSKMRGKNNIVLHDFALGKKVEQPGAVDLPLDLAVALLKDKDGVIRTNLPVEGNVDDPKFDYGKTIRQAIRKLITNVAAAPFRFLAGLVGVGSNKDLGYISFFAGRTDLSPAQNEKVKQLGEALIKRPDLQITIAGVYSASFDTAELQEEKFESKLREQLSKGLTDANIGSRKYVSTLEKLYEEKNLVPTLEELKRNAQSQSTNDESQNVDQLTYVRTVKEKLVATEAITHEDLLKLADNRAQIVYQQLTQIPGVNAAQIKMAGAREGQLNKDNKLKLELDANLKKRKKAPNQP